MRHTALGAVQGLVERHIDHSAQIVALASASAAAAKQDVYKRQDASLAPLDRPVSKAHAVRRSPARTAQQTYCTLEKKLPSVAVRRKSMRPNPRHLLRYTFDTS